MRTLKKHFSRNDLDFENDPPHSDKSRSKTVLINITRYIGISIHRRPGSYASRSPQDYRMNSYTLASRGQNVCEVTTECDHIESITHMLQG